ncbi:hypothetical protein PVT71_12335 [Salipiger sp. H15]|uniref:Uncharacterized protein n=1 Tax=Alloyangia sp. H15 TaxID=3029062 RepID=A0AAU8AE89_9RHOB
MKTATPEEIARHKAVEAKRANDPVLRKHLRQSERVTLRVVAEALKTERAMAAKHVLEMIAGLDGRSALLGAAREVARANLRSITRAVEPVTERRAVVTEGSAPSWAQGLFK